ncbi:MAG TPA: S41 family peptidase [SAR202 cluster bacterium]|nr:S41 family peptidase [SAR202 cluster bacterium]
MPKLTQARWAWWLPILVVVSVVALVSCQEDQEDAASAPAASSSQTTPTTEPAAQAAAGEPSTATEQADPMAIPTASPLQQPLGAPDGVPEELKTVWEVWALLTSEHYDRSTFDIEAFNEAAIRGMIEAIGDPHTSYVRPEVFRIENDDLYGRFEGIGASVQMRPDGKLLVVAPIEGSPAEKAGLKPGDVILAVNGESIEGLSLLEAVSKIRGPRGTEARLLIVHLGSLDEIEVSVVRDVIPLESVKVRTQPDDRFAHIRLSTFYSDTAEQLQDAIREAQSDGRDGLILDVRNNPGGLLSSVIDIVSLFVDEGLVLYEVNGAGRRTDHEVRNAGEFADIPMVLLVNESSASASEILAGALKDHERAPVIGGTTFGKGSVNILRRLENEGGLYLTFAKWFSPLGRPIEGEGVTPDIEVTSRDPKKADVDQLEKAFEVLAGIVDGTGAGVTN